MNMLCGAKPLLGYTECLTVNRTGNFTTLLVFTTDLLTVMLTTPMQEMLTNGNSTSLVNNSS